MYSYCFNLYQILHIGDLHSNITKGKIHSSNIPADSSVHRVLEVEEDSEVHLMISTENNVHIHLNLSFHLLINIY